MARRFHPAPVRDLTVPSSAPALTEDTRPGQWVGVPGGDVVGFFVGRSPAGNAYVAYPGGRLPLADQVARLTESLVRQHRRAAARRCIAHGKGRGRRGLNRWTLRSPSAPGTVWDSGGAKVLVHDPVAQDEAYARFGPGAVAVRGW